jgi:magnesium-protoporphyrin IX monomethyl ester (oxidative) cyclase
MYVRDHARPYFHDALGLDPTEYDYKVFRITSEICKQVFPLTLDIDHPTFRAGLDKLVVINEAMTAAQKEGGILGRLKFAIAASRAAFTFARLFALPAVTNERPESSRLAPAW